MPAARLILITLVFLFFALSLVTMNAQTTRLQPARRDLSQAQKQSASPPRRAERLPQGAAGHATGSLDGDRETEGGEAEIIEARIRYFRERHRELDPNERLRLVREEYERLETERQSRLGTTPAAGTTWVSIGPNNGAGRMTALAPHPTAAGTVYAGADGGGIWKTTNRGVTWGPLTASLREGSKSGFGLLCCTTRFSGGMYPDLSVS